MGWIYLLSYGIAHVFLMLFLMAFSTHRFPAVRTAQILSVCGAALLVLGFAGIRVSHPGFWVAVGILGFAVLEGTAFYISEYRDFRSVFTGLIGLNYMLPGILLPQFLFRATGHLWVLPVLGSLTHSLILVIVYKDLRPMYQELQEGRTEQWASWCVMPVLFCAISWGIAAALHGTDREWEAFWAMLLLFLTTYVSYRLIIWLVWKLYQDQRALLERGVLINATRALKREFEEFREMEKRMIGVVEEKQRMIREMRRLLAEQDYDGARTLVEQMDSLTVTRRPERFCDNPAVNGVLSSYMTEAGLQQIPVTIQTDIPVNLRVPDWELAVVIGNLLDNAIRACGEFPEAEKRRVSVMARKNGGQILIEIRNSCRQDVVFHAETGLPVSNRGKDHGIGMQSVAYFMEKYGGIFDCGMEDGEFFARILI